MLVTITAPTACGENSTKASRHSVEMNSAPPNTSRLPKRSARLFDSMMPMMPHTMLAALNRLSAEVGASLGHWNSVSPMLVSMALSPAMK
jgi:hypothetical protein